LGFREALRRSAVREATWRHFINGIKTKMNEIDGPTKQKVKKVKRYEETHPEKVKCIVALLVLVARLEAQQKRNGWTEI
jgi:hypothetical protein